MLEITRERLQMQKGQQESAGTMVLASIVSGRQKIQQAHHKK